MANTPAPSDLPPPLERLYPPKTPSKDPLPDAIARINALISTSRAAWLGLLSYLAFIGVTLLGVEDADFFITERQTDLPLIGVSVPTNLFFAIAPALGAMLATYLHLYLVKLWEALAEAPLPDTDPSLADRIQPWELADFALSFRKGARTVETRPLGLLAWIVSLALAFAATPVVLAAFWWRSMPKHDEALTVICCGIPLSFAIYSATSSFLRLRRIMQGNARPLFASWPARTSWGTVFLALAVLGWLTTEGTFKAYAERPLPWGTVNEFGQRASFKDYATARLARELFEKAKEGKLRTHFVQLAAKLPTEADSRKGSDRLDAETRITQLARLAGSANENDIADEVERMIAGQWWAQTWFPALLVQADLRNVDFSFTPDEWQDFDQAKITFHRFWCKENELTPAVCGPTPDRDTTLTDHHSFAREEWCKNNLWSKADESPTKTIERCSGHFAKNDKLFGESWTAARKVNRDGLRRRDMSGVDLRGANLVGARMQGVDLNGARMEGAVLWNARMEAANLSGARLEWADLTGSQIEGAILSRARMESAVLIQARMEGADLGWARLEGAKLGWARLERTDFFWARMEGVDLQQAQLDATEFFGAKLQATRIHGTSFERAPNLSLTLLEGTALQFVDLSNVGLSRDQIKSMFGDGSVTLPGSITRNHPDWPNHWPKDELVPDEFVKQWRLWLSNPATYTPPEPVAPSP